MDPDIFEFIAAESARLNKELEEKLPGIIEKKWENITAAVNGGVYLAPENPVRPPSDEAVIDAAKTELRRVAMILHAEARAVLQNAFLCPADVDDALSHLCEARRAITNAIDQTNT